MPKCSFCTKDYDIPRGLTFVLPNGEVLYFCSSKCQKNRKLGRRGDKQKWVVSEKKKKQTKIVVKEELKKEEKTEKVEEKVKEVEKQYEKKEEKKEQKTEKK